MNLEKGIRTIISEKLRESRIHISFAKDIINYVELLSKHVRISGIILYGSVAYGKPDINSDIDLIVVSPDFDKPYDELTMLRRKIAAKRPSRISCIWLGEKEIIKVFEAFNGFLLDALYYGIILYDEKGILEGLRKRLERALKLGNIERKLGMWRIPIEKGIRKIKI